MTIEKLAADVVIIGGGIFGMALATELARRAPRRIIVVERRHLGAGASSRNVTRVRALQLTYDLARLAIACQQKHERLGRELGMATLFWRRGYALVLYEPDELVIMERAHRMLMRELGLKPELLDGAATLKRIPILGRGTAPLGALYHHDASVHHDSVMFAYRHAARRLGIDVREHTEVKCLLMSGHRVEGVATATVEIRAPIIVNATGAWSSTISALARLEVPNTPLRREAMVTEPVKPLMNTLLTFYRPVEGWFHQTLRGEFVMGVTDPAEQPGITLACTPESAIRAAQHVSAKAPVLAGLHVVRQWAGMYDVTPDRKPTIGPVASRPGLVQMNGCNGRGFLLGPKLGELLAEWLDTGKQPELLSGFDADRFAGGTTPAMPVSTDYYAAYRQSGE
jgi:sarcosine oxidase, subunit beta